MGQHDMGIGPGVIGGLLYTFCCPMGFLAGGGGWAVHLGADTFIYCGTGCCREGRRSTCVVRCASGCGMEGAVCRRFRGSTAREAAGPYLCCCGGALD